MFPPTARLCALAALLLRPLGLRAAAPAAPEKTPKGLAKSDWQSIRADAWPPAAAVPLVSKVRTDPFSPPIRRGTGGCQPPRKEVSLSVIVLKSKRRTEVWRPAIQPGSPGNAERCKIRGVLGGEKTPWTRDRTFRGAEPRVRRRGCRSHTTTNNHRRPVQAGGQKSKFGREPATLPNATQPPV